MSVLLLDGVDEQLAQLDALINGAEQATKDGCLAGAEIVAERARELAPQVSGDMAGHIVALPTDEGAEVVGTMPYTAYQEAGVAPSGAMLNHPNGGQSHFLQTAMEDCAEAVGEEIGRSFSEHLSVIAGSRGD